MTHLHSIRRAAGLVVALAGSALGFVLCAPSAFAVVMRPVGDESSTAVVPQTAPASGHFLVSTGMAGWQIALIAIASALFAAALALLVDRVRGSHRSVGVSPA